MALPGSTDTPRTRRSILAAAAGSAAALVIGAAKPAQTNAASVAVMTEVNTDATDPTSVTNTASGETAFLGIATGAGTGLEGDSPIGIGVMGHSTNAADPENNTGQAGVVGVSGDDANAADNFALSGVYGYADASPVEGFVGSGVWGDSPDYGVIGTGGIGVEGDGGWGVVGFGLGTGAIGLYGGQEFADGRALHVEGRAEFARSGRTTVASGASTKAITHAGVTPNSLVFAVMATNEPSRYVRAVVPTWGKFTVYFNAALTSSAAIVWIVFTNPANHSG